jgi:hypothetical protein
VELGNNIYLGVNSKSKDEDKLRKTSKAVAIYIGQHFGDELQKVFGSVRRRFVKCQHMLQQLWRGMR